MDLTVGKRATRPVRVLGVLLASAFFCFALNADAQTIYTIADGMITTCNGAIVDSGGEGGPGYGNNEYYVATICPDDPSVGISLSFVIGNLNTAGVPPDELVVYDGNSTASPVIGNFTGSSLSGAVVFASYGNATGCLTLEFTSNASGTGAFAASITCFIPCLPPTAVATMSEPAPAKICPGEAITFDCTGSYSDGGFNIVQRTWDFGDGTTADGSVVNHSFADPGDYLVQLTLLDDNGCENTNLIDLQVLVGTTPTFDLTLSNAVVCEGGTIDFLGAVNNTTWTGIPEVNFGGGVALPDNVGQTFASTIENTYLIPGGTLTNINDLTVCVDMEHSFMGDLAIAITCPNGQSLVLHQQGGGGTFLGVAIDDETTPNLAGTCWNYCWSAAGTQTWVQAQGAGQTMPSGNGGTSLIPGTYSPVGNMNSLLGCPLNGTWTFSITDLWQIDNGFECGWNMDFSPNLYPDLVQFTPTVGNTPDSMAWSGTDIVVDPSNPAHASVVTTDPGNYDYTFTVTDNFGCTYDTTVTITVANAPEVGATLTLGATCSDPALLEAEIVAFPPASSNCSYTVVLHDATGDGWSGGAHLLVVHGSGQNNYVMAGGSTFTSTFTVTTGDAISLQYTSGSFNQDNSFQVFDNSGNLVYSSPQGPATGTLWTGTANCGPGTGPLVYTWSPPGSTTTATGQMTTAAVTVPTDVVVTVHPSDAPYCSTTDTIHVIPPSFLENDSLVVDANCFGEDGSITVITTGPSGPWNYSWRNGIGTVLTTTVASNGDVLNAPMGSYMVIVTEGPTGNGCIDTLMATITEPPLLEWDVVPTDTTICTMGSTTLNATTLGGTLPVGLVWDNGLTGNGPHTLSPASGTTNVYTVQAVDAHGCTTDSAQVTITVRDLITFNPMLPDSECYGIPVPYEIVNTTGGDGSYFYDWGNGPGTLNTHTVLYEDSALVCVTVTDGCETPAAIGCAPLKILFVPVLELTADTLYGCAPFSVRFDVLDTTDHALASWNFGNALAPLDSTSITHRYDIGGFYTVSVDVLWPNGCHSDTSIANWINVLTRPVAHFDWEPHPPSILDPEVGFFDSSVPNVVAWSWDFGEFGTSTQPDTIINFPDDYGRMYPVQLVAYNALGCSDTVRALVEVMDELLVYVPTSFTPNNDDLNDVLRVEGNDISKDGFELLIFDRWGAEVFSTKERSQGWDGSKAGAILPQGVYVYKLKVVSASSAIKKEFLGHVTLLR